MRRASVSLCALFLLFAPEPSPAFQMEVGPGWFFPYGHWSDGFSPGRMVEAGISFPLVRDLSLGGGFRAASVASDGGNATLDFLLPQVELTYRMRRLAGCFVPLVGVGGGLSRAVLEVGSGRETETDPFIALGGGMGFEVTSRVSLAVHVAHLWFIAPGEGKGLTLVPSFRFTI